mgnify:CR=1 FL=1
MAVAINPTRDLLVHCVLHKVLSRFFDQVGHETTYESSENKHFFKKNVTVRPTEIVN